jgi:hypothetical protein
MKSVLRLDDYRRKKTMIDKHRQYKSGINFAQEAMDIMKEEANSRDIDITMMWLITARTALVELKRSDYPVQEIIRLVNDSMRKL